MGALFDGAVNTIALQTGQWVDRYGKVLFTLGPSAAPLGVLAFSRSQAGWDRASRGRCSIEGCFLFRPEKAGYDLSVFPPTTQKPMAGKELGWGGQRDSYLMNPAKFNSMVL